jgi:thiamine biosynthesis lipoprotein
MGTLVTIQVAHACDEAQTAIDRAFGWFHEIEAHCTRFSESSELMQLAAQPGVAVPVSAILYETVQFALLVAEESGGAFDPTAGHRTGDEDVSYRDVELDPDCRTIRLRRPLTLDLGAVAKGLAVDMAARELMPLQNFAVDAGGDLYLGGLNPLGAPWIVGIRHPRIENELIARLRVSNQAVCTSGDYERRTPEGKCHILDPRTGACPDASPDALASVTVIAAGAMLADALATAAFVLGPREGLPFLTRMEVEGLIVTPELERYETQGLCYVE